MDAQITIIGAGAIGLAIAKEVSSSFSEVFINEKHPTFGQETSSRNSEVIHAGIYYPQGSLKAKLCVEGRSLLYDYCSKSGVPFNKCGKLIVATGPEEVPVLEGIRRTAAGNGVNLDLLGPDEVRSLEPEIYALAALWSPETGIIDSHSLMKRLETDSLNKGCQIAYASEVTGIRKIDGGYEITVRDRGESCFTFSTRIVINAAGLTSDRISEMAGMFDEKLSIHFCKGEYFRIRPPKNRLLKRLVYPVPHTNLEGIGIHVTIDMGGGARLGPDVKYLGSNIYDYSVDPAKQEAFWKSARKFLPFLEYDDIMPDMAGIRPKTQKHGEAVRDFYIREESERGNPGFINLIGMESPGLTSCLAIAKLVVSIIRI